MPACHFPPHLPHQASIVLKEDPGVLAAAASGITMARWRKTEGRFTREDLANALAGSGALGSTPPAAVKAWALQVAQHISGDVGSGPGGAGAKPGGGGGGGGGGGAGAASARAVVRASCRKRTPVFEPPQSWSPDKVDGNSSRFRAHV